MHWVRFATAMTLLLIIAACGARLQSPVSDEDVASIVIEEAWVRPALEEGNSAAYMNITNNTDSPIILTSVEAEFADMVQVHQTVIENEMAHMEHIANGLRIAADNSIRLQPGGYHVMLMNVDSALSEGDTVTLTLTFDNGDSIDVEAIVSVTGIEREQE